MNRSITRSFLDEFVPPFAVIWIRYSGIDLSKRERSYWKIAIKMRTLSLCVTLPLSLTMVMNRSSTRSFLGEFVPSFTVIWIRHSGIDLSKREGSYWKIAIKMLSFSLSLRHTITLMAPPFCLSSPQSLSWHHNFLSVQHSLMVCHTLTWCCTLTWHRTLSWRLNGIALSHVTAFCLSWCDTHNTLPLHCTLIVCCNLPVCSTLSVCGTLSWHRYLSLHRTLSWHRSRSWRCTPSSLSHDAALCLDASLSHGTELSHGAALCLDAALCLSWHRTLSFVVPHSVAHCAARCIFSRIGCAICTGRRTLPYWL